MRPSKLAYTGWRMPGEVARMFRRASANAQGQNTNAVIATSDKEFLSACEAAGIPPTTRQASKWRRKVGLAWEAHRRTVNAEKAA